MEFPRVVYFGVQTPGAWVCRVVPDETACQQALDAGWTLTPTLVDQEPVPPPVVAVAAPVPVPEPEPVKRRPGRPRKAA